MNDMKISVDEYISWLLDNIPIAIYNFLINNDFLH